MVNWSNTIWQNTLVSVCVSQKSDAAFPKDQLVAIYIYIGTLQSHVKHSPTPTLENSLNRIIFCAHPILHATPLLVYTDTSRHNHAIASKEV